MRRHGRLIMLALLGLAAASSAAAQQGSSAYSTEELIAILTPAPSNGTRSLSPGTGPVAAPGQPGSGLLPDLRILFPFNSAELTADTRRQLDTLGQALVSAELGTYRFELAGHTDALGDEAYNAALSARRADAVADYLESNFHVPAQRLETHGYGKSHLLDPANPTSARNRRVEIVTLE